ncbi:MAG: SDR family oxidoreductase, partial [Casimicrobiaceae bacterium]
MKPTRSLITGANRGLGLAFTRALLSRGDRVIAACRHPGKASDLNALAGEYPGRLHVLPLDIADPRSQAQLARELPLVCDGIDLLVNNAGVLHSGERFGSMSATHLEDSFRINAMGPLLLTQALASQLADGARIANITSQMGSIANVSRFGTPSYNISKAAQNMVTALLRHALSPRGIVVLALHPGWVQTEMGGSGATITPEQSADGLLRVIGEATQADSGGFLDWQGT